MYSIRLGHKLFDLSTPVVMGIVNATPDSFYPGSRYNSDRSVLNAVEKMLEDGASIIDVGGYSTRPDAEEITEDIEIKRLSVAIKAIRKHFPEAVISIDTFRAAVAREMIQEFEVEMINDIGGGTLDELMFETVAEFDTAYILMHTRGLPQNMQQQTEYTDVVADVFGFLQKNIARLRLLGVNDVIVDPGFGFAKTLEQNYTLLNKLSYFKQLGVPLLAGVSRKSMIYKLLGNEAKDALNGTTAVNMLALAGGASMLRVHDVKEASEAVKIYNACTKAV
ncbi:MAG: dihydropteroate synthase [Paludibacter sp.]|nr:dihydropteroate synthase [Paludibacter sp.]